MRLLRSLLPVLLSPLLLPVAARGDEPKRDEKAADVLFQSAKAAMERGDLGTACAQFAESQRLDPAAGTLLNLGECEERTGKLASALAHVQEARGLLPVADYRIPFADARITGLVRRVPHLTFALSPASLPGLKVSCDDRAVAAPEQPLPVDPGPHVCVAEAPGYRAAKAEASVRESETQRVDLKLLPSAAAVPSPSAASPADGAAPAVVVPSNEPSPPSLPPPTHGPGKAQRLAGLAVGATGAVGVVIGGVLGIVAKVTYGNAVHDCKNGPSSCTQPGVDGGISAHHQATASTAAFIAGGALLGAGAAIYFTAPKARVEIAPAAGPRSAGLSLQAAW